MRQLTQSAKPRLGSFGSYGGRFASELLHPALQELSDAMASLLPRSDFQAELQAELADWAGRPTPLTAVPSFSRHADLEVYLKREDLLHGGAHKTNNVVGQALLARRMRKRRLLAETGAGQHGVATAMAGARFGLATTIYMGSVDVERQHANVQRMELLGAEVIRVDAGSATLKDAINEATAGLGQHLRRIALPPRHGLRPRPVFHGWYASCRRSSGSRRTSSGEGGWAACRTRSSPPSAAAATRSARSPGSSTTARSVSSASSPSAARRCATVLPGCCTATRTRVLQNGDGQIADSHSVAAGLDYPGVGPEHAALAESGRADYATVSDAQAIEAFELLSATEGILPAFESSHALAFALQAVAHGKLERGARVLVNLSGRGDKDLESYLRIARAEP